MTAHDEIEDAGQTTAPVWAVFGDLMAGLVGAFVLILVFALGMQLDLAERLKAEVQQRQAEAQRREALCLPVREGRWRLISSRRLPPARGRA